MQRPWQYFAVSPLELFHPAGSAPRVVVVGGRCPPSLVGRRSQTRDAAPADLVVVAPTAVERRTPGWLPHAAHTVAGALHEDGVGFVLAPLAWRLRFLASVRKTGLVIGPAILHLPEIASSRYLVPARGAAARYATTCLVPRSSWRGWAASVAARLPGASRLLAQTSIASVVVRRRKAAPLFRWLAEAAGEAPPDRIIVTRTWRADVSSFTVSVVDDSATRPRFVARVGTGPPAARESLGEERALVAFAASAEGAGAAVPRPLRSAELDATPVVIETGVAGRVAASRLAERPADAPAVLDRVLEWLLRWNRATARAATLTPELLAHEVLEPGRRVAGAVPSGGAFVELLERLCRDVADAPVMLAAAHDDLTMTNVLLDNGGSIGVVDWDTARPEALPLVDFFYTIVDAYAASERYADRVRAFVDCFSPAGRHADAVRARQAPFERAFDITPGVVAVSFHACWLHHAANELERGETNGRFVAIVRNLAAHPERFRRA